MPGRNGGTKYRFDFNGKETDAESDLQDYGMRIYNAALGKFLSVDPITAQYPELTPYQFASNTPINCIDVDGMEGVDHRHNIVKQINGTVAFQKSNAKNSSYNPITIFEIEGTQYLVHYNKGKRTVVSFNVNSAPTMFSLVFWYGYGYEASNSIDFAHKAVDFSRTTVLSAIKKATGIADEDYLSWGFCNTFRHYLWQSVLTMAYGAQFAKLAGDYHEADGIRNPEGKYGTTYPQYGSGGEQNKFSKDNAIDLINNEYARQYGAKFNYNEVTKSVDSFTQYLNNLAVHIVSTVDGYSGDKRYDSIKNGSVKLFRSSDPSVKALYAEVLDLDPR